MSTKERQRLQVLGHLKHGKTTVVKSAAALGISERQMYRVLDRYRSQGDPGLIHRSRGRVSSHGYSPEIRTEALRLHRELHQSKRPRHRCLGAFTFSFPSAATSKGETCASERNLPPATGRSTHRSTSPPHRIGLRGNPMPLPRPQAEQPLGPAC
jgi:hypothetical protein